MTQLLEAAAFSPGSTTAIAPLAGVLCGTFLRIIVARLTGSDPRRVRVWIAELLIVFILATVFGVLFMRASDSSLLGPSLGATLTTYAGASGAFGYLGGKVLDPPEPWRWAAAHFVTCMCAGAVGFTAGLLIVRGIG